MRKLALLTALLALPACDVGFTNDGGDGPLPTDDDDVASDDDDLTTDDDDAATDDDDAATDDDDAATDDDDAATDDDDAAQLCEEDGFEDNDTLGTATLLPGEGDWPDLRLCDGDDDWFKLELLPGQTLSAALVFSHADGDVDLSLHDPAGSPVDLSESTTDDEEAGPVDVIASGSWYVRASLYQDAGATAGNDYDLQITLGVSGDDDDSTPADDDDAASDDDDVTPDDDDDSTPDDDDDVTADDDDDSTPDDDDDATADDDDDSTPDDDDATADDDDDSTPDDDDATADDDDSTPDDDDATADDDDSTPDDDDATADDDDATPPACAPDAFEPNDSDSSPSPVGLGLTTGLTACDPDDDWYAVDLLAGTELTVDVLFADAEGDIDLELHDPSGYEVEDSGSVTDNESLTWFIDQDGTWLVRVWLWGDAGSLPGNTYDLDLTLVCGADDHEPNDTQGAASSIGPGSQTDLAACEDDDWFSFDVGAGESIDVSTFFVDAEGDVDLELYDPAGIEVTGSQSVTDDESVSWVAATSGTWAARVWLWGDAGSSPGNPYDLDLSVGPCAADELEPNDSSPTAVPISVPYASPPLTRCTDDVDWFAVDATAGQTLTVDLWFVDAWGDLDFEVFDPDGLYYDGEYGSADNEHITLSNLPDSGTWYVRMFGWNGIDDAVPGNAYTLEVDVY